MRNSSKLKDIERSVLTKNRTATFDTYCDMKQDIRYGREEDGHNGEAESNQLIRVRVLPTWGNLSELSLRSSHFTFLQLYLLQVHRAVQLYFDHFNEYLCYPQPRCHVKATY